MKTHYVQIFSMTDHAVPLKDQYQGSYSGLNAAISTSQVDGNILSIATATLGSAGPIDQEMMEGAQVILAYRHTDTGVLTGTSEALIPVPSLPWSGLPGFEIIAVGEKESLRLKLWHQEMTLPRDRVVRIRFMKTVVYLRNFGVIDNIIWTDEPLTHGPSNLHAEHVDDDLTIAPAGGSGITMKMGQETTH